MNCGLCNKGDVEFIDSKVPLCSICKQLDRCDLFANILKDLLEIRNQNKDFSVIENKCKQFNVIVNNYPLLLKTILTIDVDIHDIDRIAQQYLRNYVISDDHCIIQNYAPIKVLGIDNSCIYTSIAALCQLDIEHGARELRVRNVIDMILNAKHYYDDDSKLHSCLKWENTWQFLVLEQLNEKRLEHKPNSLSTVCLQSLSNIINMKIRSVYPKISGASDDLRRRLNRIFSPSMARSNVVNIPTIAILWSSTKVPSSHSLNSISILDCVVPLVPKPSSYSSEPTNSPMDRCFYILSCFCPVTQGMLNELVSPSEQHKHLEAKMKKEETSVSEFRCPKCSKPCHDYHFDWRAVNLFRQNFVGARFTYILIDITSSMTSYISNMKISDKNNMTCRIDQTKQTVNDLLKEIAAQADPQDQAILTTFDEKLRNPALIRRCKASEIANEANFALIDQIQLSSRTISTHIYSVLKEVYEMLEREAFMYVDLYLFSDGIDTSPRKNDKAYQALVRGLTEKVGVKCHFIYDGSTSQRFSVAEWLGDNEADCPLSGNPDEVRAQIKTMYKEHHTRNIDALIRQQQHIQNEPINYSPSRSRSSTEDLEPVILRKQVQESLMNDDRTAANTSVHHSHPTTRDLHDYLSLLPSANRNSASTTTDDGSKKLEGYRILPRKWKDRKS